MSVALVLSIRQRWAAEFTKITVTREALLNAERAAQAGDFVGALSIIEELSIPDRLRNERAAAARYRGILNARLGRLIAAKEALAEAAELSPTSSQIWILRATVANRLGESESAAEYHRTAERLMTVKESE